MHSTALRIYLRYIIVIWITILTLHYIQVQGTNRVTCQVTGKVPSENNNLVNYPFLLKGNILVTTCQIYNKKERRPHSQRSKQRYQKIKQKDRSAVSSASNKMDTERKKCKKRDIFPEQRQSCSNKIPHVQTASSVSSNRHMCIQGILYPAEVYNLQTPSAVHYGIP